MPTQAIDLSEIIERQPLNRFIVRLIAVSVLVTFFDGYDMQGIAYVAPYLQAAFHLDKLMLANVFSIGILGTLCGGIIVGGLGDYFGRRPAIIWSCVVFGVLMCLLGFAGSYLQLLILRFAAGIALGGLLPAAWALNIEYAPRRYRSTIVTIVMLGYTLGASLAGPIAIWLIPRFGWPSAFLFGGIGSLLAACLLFFTLPESLRFLCARKIGTETIARTARSLAPGRSIPSATRFFLADETEAAQGGFRPGRLFAGELRWITPLLWLGFAMSSMAVYFAANWSPIMFESLGFTRATAALVSSVSQFGGALAGLALMRFTDRHGTIALTVMPALAVPVLLVCGLVALQPAFFLILAFTGVAFILGTHIGLMSIAGIFYPSAYRGTGAGWAATVAKVGSICGPLAGGLVLSSSLAVHSVYAILAICPLLVGACVLVLGQIHTGILRRERDVAPARIVPVEPIIPG